MVVVSSIVATAKKISAVEELVNMPVRGKNP